MADEQLPATGNLGQVISDKLVESVQQMNVLDVLKKIVATDADDGESQEVKSKLQGIIDKYASMTDREKGVFQDKVRAALASKLSSKLQDRLGDVEGNIASEIVFRLGLLAVGAVVVVFLVVFFGYKLYKSIKEKEVKREEKKKAKQMKKKK